MRRAGGLWPVLASWPNLVVALERAALGKRSRPDVARFLVDWEPRLLELQRDLEDGTYQPAGYRTFRVTDPKPRLISAAPFRDRVVHHALTQVLEPVFEPRFVRQSYACRTGFGTHRAMEAAHAASAAFPHVLQCDVRKFFPSVDHQILNAQLARAVKCRPTLALAELIIAQEPSDAAPQTRGTALPAAFGGVTCANSSKAGSNPQELVNLYFPGDDLFTPSERRHGLPLGNQTSQFFANVYLNDLDHFVLREIQPRVYCRYVDDLLLFHEDKGFLREARKRVEEHLETLRLRLHDGKSRTHRTQDGITFLGWRLFPDHRRLARANVVKFRRKLRRLQRDYAQGLVEWEDVNASLQAWNAHASHGDTWRLREQVFDQHPFSRKVHPQSVSTGI